MGCLWLAAACTPQGDPRVPSAGFSDSFDRKDLGDLWTNTGASYAIRDGELHVRGARNHPLWLRRALPHDVRIEFEARSESPDGDIKVEIFGDGVSKAETIDYTASGYVLVFGGWGNTKNIIARQNEHGADRAVGPPHRVATGHTYQMKIERRGDTLKAWADGQELVKLRDSRPLAGRGQDHFGFNDWESEVFFDNLRIKPL